MPEFFIQLYPQVRNEVVRIVDDVIDGLSAPPAAVLPDDDEDMAYWWLSSLKEVMMEDCSTLRNVLQSPGFGKGRLHIPDEGAERILRACSAVRLRLQQVHLVDVPEEVLENGKVQIDELVGKQRSAFLAYLVLAHLQEKIVESMDPDYGSE